MVVSPLENIVEDLKSLPPGRLEVAADFIQRLKRISQEERQAILAQTFGSLSPEDAEAMEKATEEGCGQSQGQNQHPRTTGDPSRPSGRVTCTVENRLEVGVWPPLPISSGMFAGPSSGRAGFQRRRASRNRPSRTNIFSRVW